VEEEGKYTREIREVSIVFKREKDRGNRQWSNLRSRRVNNVLRYGIEGGGVSRKRGDPAGKELDNTIKRSYSLKASAVSRSTEKGIIK